MGIIQLIITLLIFCLDESANYGTPTIRRYVTKEMTKEVEMMEMVEKKVMEEIVNVIPPMEEENEEKMKCKDNEMEVKEEDKQRIEASPSIGTTPQTI